MRVVSVKVHRLHVGLRESGEHPASHAVHAGIRACPAQVEILVD